ncbi:MAG: ergothioneine biosynthesis protein EgtB [Rhodospirillales bacterium]|nr:ergothioneine biosynthesis protein EgtB [Rhodospirillales bacterium]
MRSGTGGTPSKIARYGNRVFNQANLIEDFSRTRATTERLASPLRAEDQVVQSMPDASPVKWHLAHTTWFFETFLLIPFLPGWRRYDDRWGYLFNSYYEAVGARHPRAQRGLLTRPSVQEVARYRKAVDAAMAELLEAPGESADEVTSLTRLGINHEQQHQELLLTDILHAFSCNPLRPAYHKPPAAEHHPQPTRPNWLSYPSGLREIGSDGTDGFVFDNEGPRHTVFLRPFRLADRLVSNAEWCDFIDDDGYRRAALWLSDGWAAVQAENWRAPLYWQENGSGAWQTMTLSGMQPVDLAAPVCHVGFYEADAFARWAGKRLPSEAEWEFATRDLPVSGNLLDEMHPVDSPLRPLAPMDEGPGLRQAFGDVWEWTQSAYAPYPGFRPAAGAVGEYNGKFMCNQMVLRGGSCATPAGHVRATYRNFFYPQQRWQFSGLRLAEDV